MSTHTPGPWKSYALASGNSGQYAVHGAIGTINEATIATVTFDLGPNTLRKQNANAEANATLIAAAPELLGALRQVRSWLLSGIPENTYPLQWIDAAIAKAEGRA